MLVPSFLAWSWAGHGQLTTAAVTMAISELIALGKAAWEKRIREIERIHEETRDPYCPARQKKAEDCLKHWLAPLPGEVQRQDLHPGNIPWGIGERLAPMDGQARHFMRSSEGVTASAALEMSKRYIVDHLVAAMQKFRAAFVYTDTFVTVDRPFRLFGEGRAALACALHTVEDSYAPGHVEREAGTYLIATVHIWDAQNKTPDPDHKWAGHEALDNPALSKEFFEEAKRTAAAFIALAVGGMDRDLGNVRGTIATYMERYFRKSPNWHELMPPY